LEAATAVIGPKKISRRGVGGAYPVLSGQMGPALLLRNKCKPRRISDKKESDVKTTKWIFAALLSAASPAFAR
jgi:hypothetical protein